MLQETWLKPEKSFQLKFYRSFRLDRPTRGGGLLTLISSKICHKAKISFQVSTPECEILAIKLVLPGCSPFTVVNAYFPSGVQDTSTLDSVINSCGRDIVISGDFNSHHISWGLRTDLCGTRLWNWSLDNRLTCVNSGSITFVRGRSYSSLDLTFSGPSLSVTSWSTIDCSTSSDHLPIVFDVARPVTFIGVQVRTFINYNIFKKCLRNVLSSLSDAPTEQKTTIICSALESSQKKAQFEIGLNKRNSYSPWWNEECTRDYRKRKAAWKKLLHNQSPQNWSDYKFFRAVFKHTVSKAKDEFDCKHFDFLSNNKNKRALFRFLRGRKILPRQINIDSIILSSDEMKQSLEEIAKGLEIRFSSVLPSGSRLRRASDDFTEISMLELAEIVERLPDSAPGVDG